MKIEELLSLLKSDDFDTVRNGVLIVVDESRQDSSEILDDSGMRKIHTVFSDRIKDKLEERVLSTLIWGFGSIATARDRAGLVSVLERVFMENKSQALYQCLIALSNIGEDVLDGGSSFIDADRNRRLAKKLLDYERNSGSC